ncbi:tenomodulin [Bombina bombina]|uniref:tenomodulin n=1 Tax=Bombina bombina TaxID=8345 RepID=UPI00235A582D|nr:tenomodulin [Bombina bombina]
MENEKHLKEGCLHDVELSKPKSGNFKRCKMLAIIVCLLMTISIILLLFTLKNLRHQKPEKVYDAEYKFFSNGEKTTVLMEIDPQNKIETFWSKNGTEEAVEIHDFKQGITGIFFAALQKCFIKKQTKEIPEIDNSELMELQEEEITTTVFEQSILWIPGEKPIEDKEFMKNSKIFEVCKNVSVHWIYPTQITAHEFQDFEDGEDEDHVLASKVARPKDQSDGKPDVNAMGKKRQVRDLTDEDLPVNDYREVGLDFHPMWDHRGFCCIHCRRGQRYCQRVCEPLLGYYPYPYCYGSGRVICRVIMPCNWWVARMLGRV